MQLALSRSYHVSPGWRPLRPVLIQLFRLLPLEHAPLPYRSRGIHRCMCHPFLQGILGEVSLHDPENPKTLKPVYPYYQTTAPLNSGSRNPDWRSSRDRSLGTPSSSEQIGPKDVLSSNGSNFARRARHRRQTSSGASLRPLDLH